MLGTFEEALGLTDKHVLIFCEFLPDVTSLTQPKQAIPQLPLKEARCNLEWRLTSQFREMIREEFQASSEFVRARHGTPEDPYHARGRRVDLEMDCTLMGLFVDLVG